MPTPSDPFEVDWPAIADELLRRLERPAVLVDAAARVQAANSLFGTLVERPLDGLRGMPWDALIAPSPSAGGPPRLEAGARLEARLRTGGGDALEVVLQASTLGPRRSRWTLVEVTCVQRSPAPGPTGPRFLEHVYTVSLAEGTRGALTEVRGAAASRVARPGELCYRALRRRTAPCAGCGVFEGPRSGRHLQPTECDEGGFRLVQVELEADGASARVTTSLIAPDLLSALVDARIETLARRGDLQDRERELLRLLFLGRGPKDVALLLQVSERTAKYQQAMVLRKVGAASRTDLVRLLLEPGPEPALGAARRG